MEAILKGFQLFQAGGPVMYLLLACSLFAPLSFCQSFGNVFLHSAESSGFSNFLVDTARILW